MYSRSPPRIYALCVRKMAQSANLWTLLLLGVMDQSWAQGVAASSSPCDTTAPPSTITVSRFSVAPTVTVSRFSVTTTTTEGPKAVSCTLWCWYVGEFKYCLCWWWCVLILAALLLCCLMFLCFFCCPGKSVEMRQVQKVVYVDEPVVAYTCGPRVTPGCCGTNGAAS